LLEKLLDVTPIPRMGAFLEGRTVSGVWEDCHLEEHINLLKMRAVLLSLRHFQEVIQRQSLLIATDNTVHLSKGWTSVTTTEDEAVVWEEQEYKPPTFE
jgi:hypothetical protein